MARCVALALAAATVGSCRCGGPAGGDARSDSGRPDSGSDAAVSPDAGAQPGTDSSLACNEAGVAPGEHWQALASPGVSLGALGAAVVWTGTALLVWGGDSPTGLTAVGARYDPGCDRWTPMSTAGAPAARDLRTAVWTGTEMIIAGGYAPAGIDVDGGRYDPVADAWAPIASDPALANCPSERGFWSGADVLLWCFDRVLRWNAATDVWTASPDSSSGGPSARGLGGSAWTGTELLVWGGGLATPSDYYILATDGGRYDPAADAWAPIATAGAPLPRRLPVALWTGTEMLVWGGDGDNLTMPAPTDAGRYDPATDSWLPLGVSGAPAWRPELSAAWSGSDLIVWGGGQAGDAFATGARWDATLDSWSPVTDTDAPSARFGHSAVWTGTRMLLWGGTDGVIGPLVPLFTTYFPR